MLEATVCGIPVVIHNNLSKKPRIKLSPECPVGEKFRQEFDAWLLERFGADEQVFFVSGKLLCSKAVAMRIEAALQSLAHGVPRQL